MSTVWMIRHGKPSSTWGGDDEDPGLDETGHLQALAARDYLLALPNPPVAVVSSPLRRCQETALPLAKALGVDLEILPQVGEIPTPRNLSHEDRPAWLQGAMAGSWSQIKGDIDYESWRRSVADAVKLRPGVAIFSHFVAINGVVSLALGKPEVIAFRPDHASITSFETSGSDLVLMEQGRQAQTGVL
jgi:broad specificity phosphatase PhoE